MSSAVVREEKVVEIAVYRYPTYTDLAVRGMQWDWVREYGTNAQLPVYVFNGHTVLRS